MDVFLTGATGVVGRRAVPLLVAEGHRVTAVGRTPEKRARLERDGATAVDVDLFSPEAVGQAIAGHDAVVNLATKIPATTVAMFVPGAWRENDRLRRDASAVLAAAAREAGVGRFVQESFAPMYADAGSLWVDETMPVRPARYSRTTLDAERAATSFTGPDRAGVVLRFGAFYGPDSLQVRDMARAVRMGVSPLPGRPEAYFPALHLDDAATAVVAALGVPAGVYNVVDDRPLARREFVDALAEALGTRPPRFMPAWTARLMGSLGDAMSRSVRASNRAFRDASGWAPQYPSAREGWPAVVAGL